jgi:hypothetical protein
MDCKAIKRRIRIRLRPVLRDRSRAIGRVFSNRFRKPSNLRYLNWFSLKARLSRAVEVHKMKSGVSKRLISLLAVVVMLAAPLIVDAQKRKPRLRRPVRRAAVVTVPTVPVGTNLKVRIEDSLSSKESRVGDKFTATVLDPVRFNEATVEGHISSIQKSGKIKGRTSMNLAFDSIRYTDGRTAPMHGYVTKVYGSDSGTADEEGGVTSGSRTKQTIKRAGIGAGAGAIIGAIAGGGKGAAIGLLIGGAGGAGSLAVQGSKELKIDSGTEMLVRVTR